MPVKSKSPETGRKKLTKDKLVSEDKLLELVAFDRLMFDTTPSIWPLEHLIGTDEVGRGCLAGPVVAAAVVLPAIERGSELARKLALLNDSKQLPPEVREELAIVLQSVCHYAIAEASVQEIDEINILQASLLAMRRAVNKLRLKSQAVLLVDGNRKIPSIRFLQLTVTQGDSKSASIAAASILAKVYRDQLMLKLAKSHPQYCWQSNKGYGSRDHRLALDKFGLSTHHRRSFSYSSVENQTEENE